MDRSWITYPYIILYNYIYIIIYSIYIPSSGWSTGQPGMQPSHVYQACFEKRHRSWCLCGSGMGSWSLAPWPGRGMGWILGSVWEHHGTSIEKPSDFWRFAEQNIHLTIPHPCYQSLSLLCSLEVIEVGHSDALPRALSGSPWFTNVRHVQRDQLRCQMEPWPSSTMMGRSLTCIRHHQTAAGCLGPCELASLKMYLAMKDHEDIWRQVWHIQNTTRSRYLQRNVAMAQAQTHEMSRNVTNVKWKVHWSATLV